MKPGSEIPPRLDIRHTYKLLGVPPGLRAEDIQKWGEQVQWPVKPLRPSGPTQWLIGSAVPPPSGLHAINQSPILIQEVVQRRPGQAVLSAGRLPPTPLASDARGVDPLSINDPWSQYKQARGEAVAGPVGTDGPTAKKFQQADSRLEQLEAAAQELRHDKEAMRADIQGLNTTLQAEVSKVHHEMTGLGQEMQRQLQANVDALQASQRLQQQQMSQGFEELKQLLQQSQKGSKRHNAVMEPAPGGDTTMNDL